MHVFKEIGVVHFRRTTHSCLFIHKMVHEDFQTGDFHRFEVGTLYVFDNCVDRWAVSAPDRTAIIVENNESTDVKWIA